jgi:diguanylate cyclase (GGDEF)-like protein
MTDTSLQVFRTKQPAILSPTYSSFGGVLLGGSAPILDENGNLHGIVGVSIDNSQVFATTKNLYSTLIILSVSFLLLIWFLLTKVSHFFLEPMLKDKLTGAYNKRYFEAMLQKGIEVSLKAGQDLAVLMLDLDYFKKINDTYGHPFGDVVLAKVSSLIRDCLRKDDFLVRYGGEEFAVLLFNLDNYAAITVAERIRRLIEAYEIHNEKEKIDVKITISIGIANLRHKKLSSSELVNNADKALYKAKETRNAVAEFTE